MSINLIFQIGKDSPIPQQSNQRMLVTVISLSTKGRDEKIDYRLVR